MVDFLNTWSQGIIVVVIICTIIEMILPEGKNKKYIKTVIGIYVVFTIIGPIITKINTKEKLNLEKYLSFENNNTIETSIALDNNKYIENLYKEKLSSDIKNKITAFGYEATVVDLEIQTKDEENYGSVLGLNLKIGKKQEKNSSKIKIEPVKIGKEIENKKVEISQEEIEKIKEYLENVYYIDKSIISIDY